MAVAKLYRHRVELRHLLDIVKISKEEKEKWDRRIPRMLPSHILELRVNLLEQLVLDVQVQVISDIQQGKQVPEDEDGMVKYVIERVMDKIALVEKRTEESLAVLLA